MAETISYPYRSYRFKVEVEEIQRAAFAEVSGVSASVDAIEYREGNDLRNTPRKMPGLTRFGNVTLRWGVTGDFEFKDWLLSVSPTNTAGPTGVKRHNVTITLVDDAGSDGPQWLLINAWPVGYTAPDLNGMGGEVAIQSVEFCHEGLEFNPGSNQAGDSSTT